MNPFDLNFLLKIFTFLIIGIFCHSAAGQVRTEVLCFTTQSRPTIKMEMRTYFDTQNKFSFGFVRYQESSEPIPIVLRTTEVSTTSKDSPDEISTEWTEVNRNTISGRYIITTQGGQVLAMQYEQLRTGRRYNFAIEPNTQSSAEKGCEWDK
jgi:hypothetical protein